MNPEDRGNEEGARLHAADPTDDEEIVAPAASDGHDVRMGSRPFEEVRLVGLRPAAATNQIKVHAIVLWFAAPLQAARDRASIEPPRKRNDRASAMLDIALKTVAK